MIATASMNQLFFASLGSVRRFSSVLGRLSNQGSSRTLCPVRRDINILTPVEAACEPVILRHSVIKRVEDILHHKFSDRSLLAQALTHRSVVNPTTSCTAFYEDSEAGLVEISRNNERLELLGDRVFGLLVAHALYERDTSSSEGAMSAMSHVLVSRRNADAYSHSLGLHKCLLEAQPLRGQRGARYGNSFEALLGALLLDGGYETARFFFESQVVPIWDTIGTHTAEGQCQKRELQEFLVRHGLPAPAMGTQLKYQPIDFDAERRMFTQAVMLFGRKVSVASAPTRIAADQAAAKRLLKNLGRTKPTCFLIRLARQAKDQLSLSKLQATRAAQVLEGTEEACTKNIV